MKEEQVIDYLRKYSLKSSFLFKLWLYSILPCWLRGHTVARKDAIRYSLGKRVRCMKCKRKL